MELRTTNYELQTTNYELRTEAHGDRDLSGIPDKSLSLCLSFFTRTCRIKAIKRRNVLNLAIVSEIDREPQEGEFLAAVGSLRKRDMYAQYMGETDDPAC